MYACRCCTIIFSIKSLLVLQQQTTKINHSQCHSMPWMQINKGWCLVDKISMLSFYAFLREERAKKKRLVYVCSVIIAFFTLPVLFFILFRILLGPPHKNRHDLAINTFETCTYLCVRSKRKTIYTLAPHNMFDVCAFDTRDWIVLKWCNMHPAQI